MILLQFSEKQGRYYGCGGNGNGSGFGAFVWVRATLDSGSSYVKAAILVDSC